MSSVLKAVFQWSYDGISNFILMAFRSYLRGSCPYYRVNFREQTFMTFGADVLSCLRLLKKSVVRPSRQILENELMQLSLPSSHTLSNKQVAKHNARKASVQLKISTREHNAQCSRRRDNRHSKQAPPVSTTHQAREDRQPDRIPARRSLHTDTEPIGTPSLYDLHPGLLKHKPATLPEGQEPSDPHHGGSEITSRLVS